MVRRPSISTLFPYTTLFRSSQVTTLQTAMETYGTDHNGSYTGATLGERKSTRLNSSHSQTSNADSCSRITATGYTVESEAASSKDIFKLTNKEGEITRKCEK